MNRKRVFYTEVSYGLGVIILAFATALMTKADFGLSMVVAPAYLVYRKVSLILPWFTFGMAEYLVQILLLIALNLIMRKFKPKYLMSIGTTILYGAVLDLSIALIERIPFDGMVWRTSCFFIGLPLASFAVSLLFHTYIAPAAYELFVKEIAAKWKKDINRVKFIYDCSSCLLGIILSFAFFGLGRFEGIKFGTILCALLNGFLIGRFSKWLESVYEFRDALQHKNLSKKFPNKRS